jgi:DNA-binding Xre family transcriptional regulator
MPIIYNKLFSILKERKITGYALQYKDSIVGHSTYDKLRKNIGIIDSRTVEALCKYLHCQPGDIMEFVEEPAPTEVPEPESPQEGDE